MKKRTVLAFVVVAFVAGLLCSNVIPHGLATEKDSIDRRPYELYPAEQYKADHYVELYVGDNYYHDDFKCPFIIEEGEWLTVSRYEAVERGFSACPNCFYERVDIRQR